MNVALEALHARLHMDTCAGLLHPVIMRVAKADLPAARTLTALLFGA